MTLPIIAELGCAARQDQVTDRLQSYLGDDAVWWARLATENSRGEAPPYSAWWWRAVIVPRNRIGGLGWMWRRWRLRRWMEAGGVLVLVGPARAGKTRLLEFLRLPIVDNVVPASGRKAPLAHGDLPASGLFAIDEMEAHDPIDASIVLDHPNSRSRGFALAFQSAESFRSFEIWPLFATRKVLILEVSRPSA